MYTLISLGVLTAFSAAIYLGRKRIGLFWSSTLFLTATILFLQYGIKPGAPAALPTSKRAPAAVRASKKVFFGEFPCRMIQVE